MRTFPVFGPTGGDIEHAVGTEGHASAVVKRVARNGVDQHPGLFPSIPEAFGLDDTVHPGIRGAVVLVEHDAAGVREVRSDGQTKQAAAAVIQDRLTGLDGKAREGTFGKNADCSALLRHIDLAAMGFDIPGIVEAVQHGVRCRGGHRYQHRKQDAT